MIFINIQAYLFEQIVSLRPKIRLEMSEEPCQCIEYTDYLTEVKNPQRNVVFCSHLVLIISGKKKKNNLKAIATVFIR